MATQQTEHAQKRVTSAELFFDLVFVFAVTQASALLHHHPSWSGVAHAAVVFIPIYWAWVGTSVYADTGESDQALDRIGIFAVALCGLLMALAVPQAYGDRGALFGAAYLAARVCLAGLLLVRRHTVTAPFTAAVVVSGPLLLTGGLLGPHVRIWLWLAAAVVDLATPAVVRARLAGLRFEADHLPERFGLFVIIALGESIVAIGIAAASARHLDAQVLVAVALAFTLAACLWWVYFQFASSAIRHAVATSQVQGDIVREVLSYGHLSFVGGILATAVGLTTVVHQPTDELGFGAAGFLVGGCVMYLATFGYTRWRMFRKMSKTRLVAAGVALLTLPLATVVPASVTVGALVVVVTGLNVTEALIFRRAGSL